MQAWKILLADDDLEDRNIIFEAMEVINASELIHFAENGEQALDVLAKNHNPENVPRLIVLDLNMPKMNGTQTLKKLKDDERFKDIPVIIFSTSINPFEKEKCMTLGAYSYITKPISFGESVETAKLFVGFCDSEAV
jgi:CheY-like chemotaxis protein